ncbi:hypothetical protein B0H14DRAFT_2643860 [Mycena olivaceomarginata]|nr:hypothetical protein B0H14DRAFT_2643860 [Mycena olivaceomarginata]
MSRFPLLKGLFLFLVTSRLLLQRTDSEFYEFKWPIRKVAIIGAGVSWVDAGFDKVKIFERDAIPGGVWHYTDETPVEAPVPNEDPKIADYEPSLPPPGLMVFLFPPGTPWRLSPQALLVRYIRSAYSFFGINSNDENPNVSYSTRVELIEKRFDEDGNEQGWKLTLKEFIRLGPSSCKERWWMEDYDAVVIATGTFNAPNIPNIPGLAEWSRRFSGSIVAFSRVSAARKVFQHIGTYGWRWLGISADIHPFVKRNYLSLRIVSGIKQFHASNHTIELFDGALLTDIDHIIFSTGYQYTFPFLPQYHNSSIGRNEEGPQDLPQPLVTDGSHYRSLYRDFIYIDEPTLGFMNMNIMTITWSFGEYFAVALAKVWSGTAKLPSQHEMRKAHRRAVAERGGYGKGQYATFFCSWLNTAALEFGGKTVNGMDPEYNNILKMFMTALLANRNPVQIPSNHSDGFTATDSETLDPFQFLGCCLSSPDFCKVDAEMKKSAPELLQCHADSRDRQRVYAGSWFDLFNHKSIGPITFSVILKLRSPARRWRTGKDIRVQEEAAVEDM